MVGVGVFGATFFGNLTLIGSTANIVALGMLELTKTWTYNVARVDKARSTSFFIQPLDCIGLTYLEIPLMPR